MRRDDDPADKAFDNDDGTESEMFCSTCNGSGEGLFSDSVCRTCGGSGEIPYGDSDER